MFLHIGNPKPLSQLITAPVAIASTRPKLKILVIDDQPFILKEVLASHGYSIHEMRDMEIVKLMDSHSL